MRNSDLFKKNLVQTKWQLKQLGVLSKVFHIEQIDGFLDFLAKWKGCLVQDTVSMLFDPYYYLHYISNPKDDSLPTLTISLNRSRMHSQTKTEKKDFKQAVTLVVNELIKLLQKKEKDYEFEADTDNYKQNEHDPYPVLAED
jgi:hypothetical protein